MKHLFIVNPTAGGKDKTEFVRAAAEEALKGSSDKFEIYVTKARMDAPEKIREEAAKNDRLHVYACGGVFRTSVYYGRGVRGSTIGTRLAYYHK